MPIFKQEKKKNNIVYKTKYTPDRFKRFKKEGVTLKLNNQTLKLKERKELFKKNLVKPQICVSNINDSKISVKFTINEVPDKVYVDYKEINRYSQPWQNIAVFDSIKKNKETIVNINNSLGQAFKVRVSYLKDGTFSFEDRIYEDKTFKFFYDPPEMIIHKRNNIVLKFFNLERFAKKGYIRIFKKENQEQEKCIIIQRLADGPFVYTDEDVNNHDYYEYRAEVYDDLGNVYNISAKRCLYQRTLSVKNINVSINENFNSAFPDGSKIYVFPKENAVSFKIEKYNLKTEKVEFIRFIERDNQIIFKAPGAYQDCEIHIEAYDQKNSLVGWSEIKIDKENSFRIINESIETNSLFQKVIKWSYEGNVDTFIVTMKNSQRQKVISTKPHRKSEEGYIYCIDENYSKERIYTEYVINAVNEFGTIIDKKRLITQ